MNAICIRRAKTGDTQNVANLVQESWLVANQNLLPSDTANALAKSADIGGFVVRKDREGRQVKRRAVSLLRRRHTLDCPERCNVFKRVDSKDAFDRRSIGGIYGADDCVGMG